jgi:hypothetical protein
MASASINIKNPSFFIVLDPPCCLWRLTLGEDELRALKEL